MIKHNSLREFRSDLQSLPKFESVEDVRKSNLRIMIQSVTESESRLDAILLTVNHLAHFHNELEIWKFYQDIVEEFSERLETPYVIAMAAAHQVSCNSTLVKYNVLRLIYLCLSRLLTTRYIGHSNLRIGCARILIKVEQYKEASWILRELRCYLSSDQELEQEISFVFNNKEILEDLAQNAPTSHIRTLAKQILQTSGLWDNHS